MSTMRTRTCSHVLTLHLKPDVYIIIFFYIIIDARTGDGTINRMSASKLSNSQVMGVRNSSNKPSNSKLSNVSKVRLFVYFLIFNITRDASSLTETAPLQLPHCCSRARSSPTLCNCSLTECFKHLPFTYYVYMFT